MSRGRAGRNGSMAWLRRRIGLVVGTVLVAVAAAAVYSWTRPTTWRTSVILRYRSPTSSAGGVPTPLTDMAAGERVYTEMRSIPTWPVLSRVVDRLDLHLVVEGADDVPRDVLVAHHELASSPSAFAFRLQPAGDSTWSLRRVWPEVAETSRRVAAGTPVKVPGGVFSLNAPVRVRQAVGHVPEETLVGSPGFNAAMMGLRESLSGARPGDAVDLVEVSYESTDRQLATRVVNALADAVVAVHRERRTEDARERVAFLEEERARIADELRAAESELAAVREAGRIVAVEEQVTAEVKRLVEIREERARLRARHQALGRLLERARRDAPGGYRALFSFELFLQNEGVGDLLARLTRADQRRLALLQRRTPRHPDVRALNRRIADLERTVGRLGRDYRDRLQERLTALDASVSEIRARLGTVPGELTQFSRSRRRAVLLAEVDRELRRWLAEARLESEVERAAVEIVERSPIPDEPAGPDHLLHLGAAGGLGLVLALLLGRLRDGLDQRFGSDEDPSPSLGVPLLGRVGPESPEAMARLRTAVHYARAGGVRQVLVAAPNADQGAGHVAEGLAESLAADGRRTVLVDARPRPRQSSSDIGDASGGEDGFDSGEPAGLGELLEGACDLDAVVASAERELTRIPPGSSRRDPSALVASDRGGRLFQALARRFDAVVVRSPAILDASLASELIARCPTVLLVIRPGETHREAARAALRQVRWVGGDAIGVAVWHSVRSQAPGLRSQRRRGLLAHGAS